MRIAVIGAGFAGLAAAYSLTKEGKAVTIFEKDPNPGGLAIGFRVKPWNWTLEKHYHHWFTNDTSVLDLAKKINYPVLIKRPKTSVFINEKSVQLDSPKHVLTFSHLPIIDRLRMAATLGILKYNPIWQPLEKFHAASFLKKTMGGNAYSQIWEPQLKNKFGFYANDISLAWFWARIKKRTSSLAYPEGGFLSFAEALVNEIEKNGGKFHFNTDVIEISSNNNVEIKYKIGNLPAGKAGWKLEIGNYDKVVVTLPSFQFTKLAPQLAKSYVDQLLRLKGLGAINLVLRLKKQFLKDNTYWLSICDTSSPIMAIVEHTNFMDKKYYNNEHIVYLGNYLPHDHKYFSMDENQLLAVYDPFLKKIHTNYKQSLIKTHMFKAPFAQPIIPINYSKHIPPFTTPLKNVYLANMQQVYPWDRGTNYAVELGEKVANLVVEDNF